MSMEPLNAASGAVTTIADADLMLAIGSGGAWTPISFANLMLAIRSGIQVGGRNLLLQKFKNKSANASESNGSATFNSDVDSYIRIEFADLSLIQSGKQYTVSFDVAGLADGNSWGMYIIKSNESVGKIDMKNGRNYCTFVMPESFGSALLLDDANRTFPNGFSPITLSNFQLEEGNVATAFNLAPEEWAEKLRGGNWLWNNKLRFSAERRCA